MLNRRLRITPNGLFQVAGSLRVQAQTLQASKTPSGAHSGSRRPTCSTIIQTQRQPGLSQAAETPVPNLRPTQDQVLSGKLAGTSPCRGPVDFQVSTQEPFRTQASSETHPKIYSGRDCRRAHSNRPDQAVERSCNRDHPGRGPKSISDLCHPGAIIREPQVEKPARVQQ